MIQDVKDEIHTITYKTNMQSTQFIQNEFYSMLLRLLKEDIVQQVNVETIKLNGKTDTKKNVRCSFTYRQKFLKLNKQENSRTVVINSRSERKQKIYKFIITCG